MSESETTAGAEQRRAVALGYDRSRDSAPRVVASGRGAVAERILDQAAAHGVPVESDPDLAACLGQLELGERIPEQAFQGVAALLAFLYRLNGDVDGPD